MIKSADAGRDVMSLSSSFRDALTHSQSVRHRLVWANSSAEAPTTSAKEALGVVKKMMNVAQPRCGRSDSLVILFFYGLLEIAKENELELLGERVSRTQVGMKIFGRILIGFDYCNSVFDTVCFEKRFDSLPHLPHFGQATRASGHEAIRKQVAQRGGQERL